MEKLSSFLCSQRGSAQLRRTLQPHFFFFKKKKPPGSDPLGKQHLQARASANTHPDFLPWKTSGSRPNSLPAQHSRTTYPPTTHPARSRAISSPPNTARPAFLTSKPVLQSTFTPGVLFKARQGSKQIFLFTIREPAARKPVPQLAAAKPNQNMDAFQSLHLFF